MHYKKLSAYLFIVGALIAILSSAFTIKPAMQGMNYLFLIIIGTFLGLMNKDDKDEVPFLVAGGVFILAVLALFPLMSSYALLGTIAKMLFNLVVLVAPLCIVIALKLIMGFASQTEDERAASKTTAYHQPAPSKAESIWHLVLVVTVSVVFIILILELFFNVEKYRGIINFLDYIIIFIFLVDLVFLYKKSESIHYFFHHYWLDIVAVLPFGIVFRAAKFLRFADVLKTISKSGFVTEQVSALDRSLKFFSEEPALKLTRTTKSGKKKTKRKKKK